jgi:hypothetical protein
MLASIDSPQGDQAPRSAANTASSTPITTTGTITLDVLVRLDGLRIQARATGSDPVRQQLLVDAQVGGEVVAERDPHRSSPG